MSTKTLPVSAQKQKERPPASRGIKEKSGEIWTVSGLMHPGDTAGPLLSITCLIVTRPLEEYIKETQTERD